MIPDLARRAVAPLLMASALCALVGCGADGIGVKPVTGRVTYKGEPLQGALIMFRPKSGGARVASGYTRDDGTFVLATSGADRGGAMAGDYDVLISKVVEIDAKGMQVDNSKQEYNPAAPPQEKTRQKSLIPEKYNAPNSPLLSATVGEGRNDFTFDLTD
jgi:hypothetical protein